MQRTGRIVVKLPVDSGAVQAAKASAKTTSKAVQTVKTAARVAAQTAQSAVKVLLPLQKQLSPEQRLSFAIAAGGWAAVAIILVLCVIGLIAGSCFGIFFSGETAVQDRPCARSYGRSMPTISTD